MHRLQSPISYNGYQAVMTAALEAGEGERAVEVLLRCRKRGFRVNQKTACGLMTGLLRASRKRGTRKFVVLAQQCWQQLAEQETLRALDTRAVTIALNVCAEAGDLAAVKQLLEHLRVREGSLHVGLYNVLVKGHCLQSDIESAWAVVRQMKEEDVAPDEFTYNTIMAACAAKHDVASALALMEQVEVPDVRKYSTLMKAMANAGRPLEETLGVLDAMDAAGVKPNLVTYSTAMDACIEAGDFQRAQVLLEQMMQQDLTPNRVVFNTMLKLLAHRQDVVTLAEMDQVLNQMHAAGVLPSVDTFNTVLAILRTQGENDRVVEQFEQMVGLGFRPDSVTMTVVMEACIALGSVERAMAIFRGMQAQGLADAGAWNSLVSAYASQGFMAEAESALREAVRACPKGCGQQLLPAYGAVLDAFCRMKDTEKAVATLRAFYGLGGTPDQRMYQRLLTACVRDGNFHRALQVVRAMEVSGVEVEKGKLRLLIQSLPSASRSSRIPSDSGASSALERFKWWVGLPNRYYDMDDE